LPLIETEIMDIYVLFIFTILTFSNAHENGNFKSVIRLVSYENADGSGANGHCCDGKHGICQSNGCDHRFTICVSTDSIRTADGIQSPICNLFEHRTESIENQNSIVFADDIGGMTNPIVVESKNGASLASITVRVEDQDNWNAHDFVDYLWSDVDVLKTTSPRGQDISMTNRTRMEIKIRSECIQGWYGSSCDRSTPTARPTYSPTDRPTPAPTTTAAPLTYTDGPEAWKKRDCDSLAVKGGYRYQDGVYSIQPENSASFQVYCDMGSRGWTIIQRRSDGSVDFNRDWDDYKNGFGDISAQGNYWLGLENIHKLTSQGSGYKLQIQMRKANGGFVYANYGVFSVEGEGTGYRLDIGNFDDTSSAGDSLSINNGQSFSTKDRDNDGNCAQKYAGGWWFVSDPEGGSCEQQPLANLNGPYIIHTNGWPRCERQHMWECILWSSTPGYEGFSLMQTQMKVQPISDKKRWIIGCPRCHRG